MSKKLSLNEINHALKDLPSWHADHEKHLAREFKFKTFREAFSFMTRVAFEAEELNHHPDWSNSYNSVQVKLTTHSARGVTEKDLELARRIDRINWT